MSKSLNLIEKYVPRHLRLGIHRNAVSYDITHDVVESIPVVDDDGYPVRSESVVKSIPAHEDMMKYKRSAFRLSAMVKSGVPLKVVNVNNTNTVRIDQLVSVCGSLDSAEKYVQMMEQQQKERQSWFVEPGSENSNV